MSARAAPPAVVTLAALVTLLVAVPAAANDLGLSVGPVELKHGVITVTYRADTPWTPRFTETLLRGMPATVTYEVGLWKKRTFWFDKLVLAIKSETRVFHDPWDHTFRVHTGSARQKTRTVPTMEALDALLFAERNLPLVAAATLEPEGRYYVSVRLTIRPLTAEDLDEVEDWLSGEVKNPEGPERGVPGYLLGIAVNVSGLGDRTALARSETFRPSRLEAPESVP